MIHSLLLIAIATPVDQDPKVNWLAENAVPIRSVSPNDDDFSDLMPLKAAIGDARVVQLGEQTHGDGTTFLAKSRLIRFLHQEMGFDVLSWESGMFDCSRMNEAIADPDRDIEEAALQGIFGLWATSAECRPLLDYVRETTTMEHPLEMAGIDVQLSGTGASELGEYLSEFLDAAPGMEISAEDQTAMASLLEGISAGNFARTPGFDFDETAAVVERIGASAESAALGLDKAMGGDGSGAAVPREFAFATRCLRNLAIQLRIIPLFTNPQDGEGMQRGSNLRDVAMGENIAWLANNHYRGRKIIVWAASRHIAHDLAHIDTGSPSLDYSKYVTQGDAAHEALGDEMYTILFDAYQGKAGQVGRPSSSIGTAADDSLTGMMHATGKPLLFLDLRGLRDDGDHWLNQPIVAQPFGYGPMTGHWGAVSDAIVFTDTMQPSTRAE